MTEQQVLAAKRTAIELRCRVIQTIRSFFLEEDFLEVQTPVRTPAPAPEANIDAVQTDDGWFLITSPELYMKRMLAAGFQRVFQISPVFRRGELGRLHHPEFTILEWYRAGADYTALQDDCRRLLSLVCEVTNRLTGWTYQGRRLEVATTWKHTTVREAFQAFAGWEPDACPDHDRFDLDLVEKVEPHLGFPTPCILSDYPAGEAALARLKESDPNVAERFELYWAGIELANGFSELTDAREQRERFLAALETRRHMGLSGYPLPEAFLRSVEHLPPCAGIALGVDRLVMLLADAKSLDEVTAFPPALDSP
jgi:elongation factor P--(R)-beta-lysine ligase